MTGACNVKNDSGTMGNKVEESISLGLSCQFKYSPMEIAIVKDYLKGITFGDIDFQNYYNSDGRHFCRCNGVHHFHYDDSRASSQTMSAEIERQLLQEWVFLYVSVSCAWLVIGFFKKSRIG